MTEEERLEFELEKEKFKKAYEEKTGEPYPFDDPDIKRLPVNTK